MYFAQFYSNTVCCILFSTLTPPSTQWHLFEDGEVFLKHNWVPPGQFPHLMYQFFRGQSCKISSLIFPEGSGYFCCIQPWKVPLQIQFLTHAKEQNTFIRTSRCFYGMIHFKWSPFLRAINVIDKIYILFASRGPSLKFTALLSRFESLELCGTVTVFNAMEGEWKGHLNVLILKYKDTLTVECAISCFYTFL